MAVSSTTNTAPELTTALDDLSISKTEREIQYRGSSELGKEEFLKLLVCQLQNQDPLNPQDDTDFVAQLAQFSALEQMTNMNSTMTNTSAYSLVGKEVIVQTKDSTGAYKEIRGTVDYVEIKNGEAKLAIDGNTYSLDDLVQVMDTFYAAKQYLPSVEESQQTYDRAMPSIVKIKLNLGSNGYEASSVAVSLNGQYIDTKYLTYNDGDLEISPEAFQDLAPGTYQLGFYFDDPYQTSVTDKVTIQVINSAANDKTEETDPDHVEETDPAEEGETENA